MDYSEEKNLPVNQFFFDFCVPAPEKVITLEVAVKNLLSVRWYASDKYCLPRYHSSFFSPPFVGIFIPHKMKGRNNSPMTAPMLKEYRNASHDRGCPKSNPLSGYTTA